MILLDYLWMNVSAFTTNADFQYNKYITVSHDGVSDFEI